MIIGVTGTICSGKGKVTEYIGQCGFEILSFGGAVRDEAARLGIEPIRKNLQKLGDSARRREKGIWVQRLFDQMSVGNDYVVDGFRYLDQIDAFRERVDFYLVGVDASFNDRFAWNLGRKRAGDPRTKFGFWWADYVDKKGHRLRIGQNTLDCLRVADQIIYNDRGLDDLRRKVYRAVVSIK